MKTAVYIEDGFTQIVLTPENPLEIHALSLLKEQSPTVVSGEFYYCVGGWQRRGGGGAATDSTMLKFQTPTKEKE